MVNTQVYLNNIKSDLAGLSWASVEGGGSSSFVAVYTYPVWVHDQGYPFLVILDNPTQSENENTSDYEIVSNIEFHICANWATTDGTTDSDKREEAMIGVREAYDAVREFLSDDTNIATWVSSPTNAVRGAHANLTWRSNQIAVRDDNIDEFNVYRRVITLPISDIVNI